MSSTPFPQQIPYFGKAWYITVQLPDGSKVTLSSDQFSEGLRAAFRVDTMISGQTAYWPAEVSIYNINAALAAQMMQTGIAGSGAGTPSTWNFNKVLTQGALLSLSAGYRYSQSGAFDPTANLIYQGHLFQPRWTREHVVDTKITLRCYLGLIQDALNPVNFNVPAGLSDYDTILRIATEAHLQANISPQAQSVLQQNKYGRGQAVTGSPYAAINERVPKGLQFWVSPNGINIRSLSVDPNTVPICVYGTPQVPGAATSLDQPSPQYSQANAALKRTILGTPEQTQGGVRFRVLMDAQPKIGDTIQLAPGTTINRQPLVIGNYPSILDKNGLYVIAGISHTGDTRGEQDDWYTEIDALNNTFFPVFLPSAPNVTQ